MLHNNWVKRVESDFLNDDFSLSLSISLRKHSHTRSSYVCINGTFDASQSREHTYVFASHVRFEFMLI